MITGIWCNKSLATFVELSLGKIESAVAFLPKSMPEESLGGDEMGCTDENVRFIPSDTASLPCRAYIG